jgi:DNA-directed RNA polymerase subunit RPC12/RpoP
VCRPAIRHTECACYVKMNVTYRCPNCQQTTQADFGPQVVACSRCGTQVEVPAGAVTDDRLTRCLLCPSTELFVRKDFSQTLGVTIVVIGFVISSVFWYYRMPLWTYGVLFATALIDVVLYLTVGNVLQCYRCQAQYRGVPGLDQHEPFDLETHEKHRQQQARLPQAGRG